MNTLALARRTAIGVLCALCTLTASSQQSTVDSNLLRRIDALEQQIADQKPGESHLMIVGLATFGFNVNKTTITPPGGPGQSQKTVSLGDADRYEFSPMLLWRHGTKWLVEFEPSFDGNTIGVNWANISYFAVPGLIIHAGYFVLPFGIYNKKLAAGWIDKVAPDPAGLDLPGTDFGVGVSGGLPLGNMKWTYDLSLTNGLQLMPDGELQGAGIVDNNLNKTVSGRLSLLPFSNGCLEVGVSALYGGVAAGEPFNNANTTMYGADLNFVKTFSPFLVNVKGQYSRMLVNSQPYIKPTDSSEYTFDNRSNSTFIQCSFRPVSAPNAFVRNLELAFRYVNYETPANSFWGQNYHEEDLGLDYWLSWRTVFKITYAWSRSTNSSDITSGQKGVVTGMNNLYFQFSIQL
ncbi:MAG: hypothetical protein JST42_08430 [Bacteroidetes bacterium]|nr:hypothetical protein [Bacteroidota bacterium]